MATGRRDRLRARVRNVGLDALAPHEVLEFMLYPFIIRKDTCGTGRALIEEFGSLENVLRATERELSEIKGMTKTSALYISRFKDLHERFLLDRASRIPLTNPNELENYLKSTIAFSDIESVVLILLDAKFRLIRRKFLTNDNYNQVEINLRNFLESVLDTKARFVILAHNHPNGDVVPSKEDLNFTKKVKTYLDGLGVKLVEHAIVSGERSFSFREEGHLD